MLNETAPDVPAFSFTYLTVANWLSGEVSSGSGAVGIPVKLGDSVFAFFFFFFYTASLTGLSLWEVLSTFPHPTLAFVIWCGLGFVSTLICAYTTSPTAVIAAS